MSALPPIATAKADISKPHVRFTAESTDMCDANRHVCFGPEADIVAAGTSLNDEVFACIVGLPRRRILFLAVLRRALRRVSCFCAAIWSARAGVAIAEVRLVLRSSLGRRSHDHSNDESGTYNDKIAHFAAPF